MELFANSATSGEDVHVSPHFQGSQKFLQSAAAASTAELSYASQQFFRDTAAGFASSTERKVLLAETDSFPDLNYISAFFIGFGVMVLLCVVAVTARIWYIVKKKRQYFGEDTKTVASQSQKGDEQLEKQNVFEAPEVVVIPEQQNYGNFLQLVLAMGTSTYFQSRVFTERMHEHAIKKQERKGIPLDAEGNTLSEGIKSFRGDIISTPSMDAFSSAVEASNTANTHDTFVLEAWLSGGTGYSRGHAVQQIPSSPNTDPLELLPFEQKYHEEHSTERTPAGLKAKRRITPQKYEQDDEAPLRNTTKSSKNLRNHLKRKLSVKPIPL